MAKKKAARKKVKTVATKKTRKPFGARRKSWIRSSLR